MFNQQKYSLVLMLLLACFFVVIVVVQDEWRLRDRQKCEPGQSTPPTLDLQNLLLLQSLKPQAPSVPSHSKGPVTRLQSLEPLNGTIQHMDSKICNVCRASHNSLHGHISVTWDELKQKPWEEYPNVQLGGRHHPDDCCPEEKLAIIIPFRNRSENLQAFVQHMHPFLIRQKRYYTIYVVEQADTQPFNRASLFNIGVLEAMKQDNFDCFIFHDVDSVPINDQLIYRCSENRDEVLHYAIYLGVNNFRNEHMGRSGGIVAMRRDQFMRMNGFSNCYWGWGAEDDDIRYRIEVQNFKFTKIEDERARYLSLGHGPSTFNQQMMTYLKTAANRLSVDGLNSLKYRLLEVDVHTQYTNLKVLLDRPGMNTTCLSDELAYTKLNNLFGFQN